MRKHQTAFVVVTKEWINTAGINTIVAGGKHSEAAGETHLIIANLKEHDHHGVWLSGVTTAELRRDGTEVVMDFMIPWSVIVGVGVLEGKYEGQTVGFMGATMHGLRTPKK
jgi:hypothetical protein